MFSQMIRAIREEVTGQLFNFTLRVREEDERALQERWGGATPVAPAEAPPVAAPPPRAPSPPVAGKAPSGFAAVREGAPIGSEGGGKAPIRRDQPKVGRNDACPCGSGKKYKKCHGEAD